MKIYKNLILGGAVLLFSSLQVMAELGMPFPQAKEYGLRPTGSVRAHAEAIQKQYDRYVDEWWDSEGFFQSSATNVDAQTVSEQHGYGMIITAIMGDKERFDKMVSFYKNNQVAGSLMNWIIGGGGWSGSATDGDLDIAFAFLLAHHQWGDAAYLSQAETMLGDIYSHDLNEDNSFLALGSSYSDRSLRRPSDWMAGHMRIFADVDDQRSATWSSIAEEIYNNYWWFVEENTGDGFISDFVRNNSPASNDETEYDEQYYMNSCRVPMRFAMDYARHANDNNGDALTAIVGELSAAIGEDPSNMKRGYYLDGSPLDPDGGNGVEFLAPFGAGLIATSNQSLMDATWDELQKNWTTNPDNDITAYADALKLISMLVMTGNWWTYGDEDTHDDGDIGGDYIVFDHFDNEYGPGNAQNHLGQVNGVVWGDEKYGSGGGDTTYYHGGGWWYAYGTGQAEIIAQDGTEILPLVDETSDDLDAIIPEDENHMSISVHITGDDEESYDNAGIGGPIVEDIIEVDDDSTTTEAQYVSLENLEAIKIRARGEGTVRMSLETKDVADTVEQDPAFWGNYGYNIELKEEWTEHIIEVVDLEPQAWSPLDTLVTDNPDTWGWGASGSQAVGGFLFSFSQDEMDQEVNIDLDVDYIRFYGMNYEDIGLKDRPASIIGDADKIAGRSLADISAHRGVELSFNTQAGQKAQATLYTVHGREIASAETITSAGLNNIDLGSEFSTGVYFLTFTLDNQQMTRQIRIK
ncbi:MAG: glycosyl hydrolase family 8 [Fibrobacterota bacterium]